MRISEIAQSVAYCGLVCKLCHEAEECSGCRSKNNICKESECFHKNCCMEKGINGCWECVGLDSCEEHMFNESHDLRIKAFCKFIKLDGLDKLSECLCRNEKFGVKYGYNGDYDNLDNEGMVFELLRTGKK